MLQIECNTWVCHFFLQCLTYKLMGKVKGEIKSIKIKIIK